MLQVVKSFQIYDTRVLFYTIQVSQYGLEILATLAERLPGNFRNSLNSGKIAQIFVGWSTIVLMNIT